MPNPIDLLLAGHPRRRLTADEHRRFVESQHRDARLQWRKAKALGSILQDQTKQFGVLDRCVKTLSALAESSGGALVAPPEQGHDACHCGGSCDSCRDDLCGEVSAKILDLDRVQSLLLQVRQGVRSYKNLRDKFGQLGILAPPADETERDVEGGLQRIVAKRQSLLKQLCDRCPDDKLCHTN